ncbi:hypothetical protein V6N13_131226 [Hibiscus sabdariffa]|uniref:Uncharacterized protein n=1 Tax=Hibiscus sabdariffa TaxID=183260 RepID=A0ABR2D784_9ROSI
MQDTGCLHPTGYLLESSSYELLGAHEALLTKWWQHIGKITGFVAGVLGSKIALISQLSRFGFFNPLLSFTLPALLSQGVSPSAVNSLYSELHELVDPIPCHLF